MREAMERICRDAGWPISENRITIPLPEGRKQVVEFEGYEARGIAFGRLFSRLGDAASLDERRLSAALRLNWTLPYGAVAIASLPETDGETLILCDSFAADRIEDTPDRVQLAIRELAETADSFERFVFGRDDH